MLECIPIIITCCGFFAIFGIDILTALKEVGRFFFDKLYGYIEICSNKFDMFFIIVKKGFYCFAEILIDQMNNLTQNLN